MVRSTSNKRGLEAFNRWREANKLEIEILQTLDDALSFHAPPPVFDEDGVIQDREFNDQQMRVLRVAAAIRAMMKVPQARKTVGLPRLGRGKSYDPEDEPPNSPAVQVALKLVRNQISEKKAIDEVIFHLSSTSDIDSRTAKNYLMHLVELHRLTDVSCSLKAKA